MRCMKLLNQFEKAGHLTRLVTFRYVPSSNLMKKSLQKNGLLQVFLVLSASLVDSLVKQLPVKFLLKNRTKISAEPHVRLHLR